MVDRAIIFYSAITLDLGVMPSQYSGRVVRGPGLIVRCVEGVWHLVESVNEVVAKLTTRTYTTDNLL